MRDRVTTSRRQSTETALQDAARQVFAEKGYLNTTITDITRRAGRSAGSFYNYYDTKQQLLTALLAAFPRRIVDRALDDLGTDWRATVEAAVRAYVRTFRDYLPEMIGAFQLAMTDAEAALWWRSMRKQGIDAVLALVDFVEADGVTVDLDHGTFASAIVSMLESYCWTWLAAGGDDGPTEYDEETAVRTIATMWQRAMVGPSGP